MILTLTTFLLFTGFVAGVTWYLTRGDDHETTDGYFLAGRTLTAGFIAGSLMLTNLSTEQLVGLNGAAFTHGFSVMAWEVVAAVGLILMALYFLPRFLKSGITTVPEYLELRFGASTRAIATFIFVAAYALLLLPIILYSGAKGLSTILDLSTLTGIESETTILWLTVIVVGVMGFIYAIFGGLRTVAVSDTINGFGLLVGGVMITVFGLIALGGEDGGLSAGWTRLMTEHPEKMNSIGGPDQEVPFGTLFTGVLLLNLFYWCTNQQIIQRTLGASSLAEGQKGVLLTGALKLLGPLILVFPGIIAFHLYAGEGISADSAYGTLVSRTLPAALSGFFAAVMVGAILSSFNSALNSTATLFSLGIYKTMINPEGDHQAVVSSGKKCGTVVAAFAILTAPLLASQASIFGYLQAMNGIYFIPLFAVIVTGLLTKMASAKAANIALVGSLLAMILGSFPFAEEVKSVVHNFHFMGIVFLATVVVLVVLGKVMPREEAFVQVDCGAVDMTPWKHAKLAGGILFAIVLTIYISFADFSILRG